MKESEREILLDIFENTESPHKIIVELREASRDAVITLEDLDDEWFRELKEAKASPEPEPYDGLKEIKGSWTKEKPTKPGYYWFYRKCDRIPELLQISFQNSRNDFMIQRCGIGTDRGFFTLNKANPINGTNLWPEGYWLGPLEAPTSRND